MAALKAGNATNEEYYFWVGQILAHYELSAIYVVDDFASDKLRSLIEESLILYLDQMAAFGYVDAIKHTTDDPRICPNLKDFCIQRQRALKQSAKVFEMLHLRLS